MRLHETCGHHGCALLRVCESPRDASRADSCIVSAQRGQI